MKKQVSLLVLAAAMATACDGFLDDGSRDRVPLKLELSAAKLEPGGTLTLSLVNPSDESLRVHNQCVNEFRVEKQWEGGWIQIDDVGPVCLTWFSYELKPGQRMEREFAYATLAEYRESTAGTYRFVVEASADDPAHPATVASASFRVDEASKASVASAAAPEMRIPKIVFRLPLEPSMLRAAEQ